MTTLRFTGRSAELEAIRERWRLAADTENPQPQMVLITGERGVGKTRLAFEFYRWLRENADRSGPHGYWPPDALAIYDNAVAANPQPRNCNFNVAIPYLWWGLHVSTDTIPSSDGYLAPHLAALLAGSIKRRRSIDLTKAYARLGIDVALGILPGLSYVGLAKRIVEGTKETVGLIREGLREASVDEALGVPQSRASSILQNLELVFDPRRDYARVPGVILIDDAQDAENDPGLLAFMEGLFHKAMTGKWPLLILVTHWKRELSPEVTPGENSFVGILRHGRFGSPRQSGPVAGLPGGHLNDGNFTEIALGPLDDLSTALREQLPGLTAKQAASLLEATGGNPRYLEQVISFAREHEGFFEDYDVSKALTEGGFREILDETRSQDIFKVVRRRLMDAPVEVQEAICLASLQGVRFANELVEAVAYAQIGHGVGPSLEKAEDPYQWLAGTKRRSGDGIGAFMERLFHQVAEDVRPHVKTLGTEPKLQVTFRDTIRKLVKDKNFAASGKPETQLIAYRIAADLFERSDEPGERVTAQQALQSLATVEVSRSSLEAATATLERLLAIEPVGFDAGGQGWGEQYTTQFIVRMDVLDDLFQAYWRLNRTSKCSSAVQRRISSASTLIGGWAEFARMLAHAGDIDGVNRHLAEFKKKAIATRQQESEEKIETLTKLDAWASGLYHSAVSFIVPDLLRMSELARAWPSLTFADDDDPVGEAPFMLAIGERDGKPIGSGDQAFTDEISDVLRERAYNLGAFAEPRDGANYAQREHLKLLIDTISRQLSDDLKFDASLDALQRALTLAEELGDQSRQIDALNNLGVVYGQKGDRDQSEKALREAGRLINERIGELSVGGTFSVAVLADGSKIEYRRLEAVSQADKSRICQEFEIPNGLVAAFDHNPGAVVGQFLSLIHSVGSIEGNFARNALESGDLEKAKKSYHYSLENFLDLNDGPNIAMTFAGLATVAQRSGDREAACGYWRESLSVYQKLKEVHSGEISEIRWRNAIDDLKAQMEAAGCAPDGRGLPQQNASP